MSSDENEDSKEDTEPENDEDSDDNIGEEFQLFVLSESDCEDSD